MLIRETFTGMKLELMPAISSAAAHTFLVLLGNCHELSDTSSTSVVLKIKNKEKSPFWIYCVHQKKKMTLTFFPSLSLSNLPPVINRHREILLILLILFIFCLKCWVSQKEIFYWSAKIVKPVTCFIKLPSLTSGSFCHWHQSSLYFF